METNTKNQIGQALKQAMEAQGLKLKQVEAATGISYGTISNVVNGKHDNISDAMFRKLASWLKLDSWKMVDTHNFATVKELLWEAQEYSRFFGIVGESGYGKTAALRAYKSTNPNCYYMLSDVLMTSKKNFLNNVQKALGISKGNSPADMLEAIVEKLNSTDRPLLIIDDAGKLNDSNLRIIQLIYDRTERSCGIIMAGTPFLKDVLEKGITRNKMGFDELFRRVQHWERLYAPTMEEKRLMCTVNGINENPPVVNYIVNTCKNFGSVRATITTALRLKDKGELSAQELQKIN